MSEHMKYIQTLPFNTLIDMGCGTGDTIVEIADLRSQAYFIGLDVDDSALGKARERIRDGLRITRVDFVCGNCSSVPLAADSVDVIIFRALLHHIEQIECAFDEAKRILRKGGFLLIQDGEEIPMPLFEEMNTALRQGELPSEMHPGFNIDKLTEQLKKHNLVKEAVIREGVATFATPPYAPKVYSTGLFLLSARKI